jgi:hypothetical protein
MKIEIFNDGLIYEVKINNLFIETFLFKKNDYHKDEDHEYWIYNNYLKRSTYKLDQNENFFSKQECKNANINFMVLRLVGFKF